MADTRQSNFCSVIIVDVAIGLLTYGGAPHFPPVAWPGDSSPVPVVGAGDGEGSAGAMASAVGPICRRPGTNRTAPTVHFPHQTCPECSDGRVFVTRLFFVQHLKRIHGRYWNGRAGVPR